ncbi:class I SAM-dependent methyltransferase [Culicoidibacter larvae]|uniref:Methyltransferase domain-containing protein n=1 Tax=Culicoidibacter larvae TaxID=2579976 RepID=A0A5R8Q809_9FIRM|nr:class I SAM-dependent methyltransferase [Culicoidibacter larvae]TLG71527.1 methyltransferase domain-containing protein [Culicoidibacter larvae]
MKENKYDNPAFFDQYSKMERSTKGLAAAGEWHVLKTMLPDFNGKRVLDLGCGFGWHCQYAAAHGAKSVLGIDLSANMLKEAQRLTTAPQVEYRQMAIEDIDFPADSFDIVISSLAFHYVQSFADVVAKIKTALVDGGHFVFSAEHPIFTAQGTQDWYYDENQQPMFWPVDRYFDESVRTASFLGEAVQKYHKTMSTYINTLLQQGFELTAIAEPDPDPELLKVHPEYKDELRRPMFLLLSAINHK